MKHGEGREKNGERFDRRTNSASKHCHHRGVISLVVVGGGVGNEGFVVPSWHGVGVPHQD